MSKKRKASDLQSVRFSFQEPSNSNSFIRGEDLTEDHRRIRVKKVPVQLPSPKKSSVVDEVLKQHQFSGFDWDDTPYNPLLSGSLTEESSGQDADLSSPGDRAKKATQRSASSARPMNSWLGIATKFLAELMTKEGRGDRECLKCCHCGLTAIDLYRCRNCWGNALWCAGCIKDAHRHRPFDVVEHWNGKFFERTSLAKLGLVVQLGHPVGVKCANPKRVRTGFVVADRHGVQEDVLLSKCECRDVSVAGELWQQLLRYGLYPATVEEPRTAFTVSVLEHFHTLTLQGKVSLYDYYHALESLTDHSGVSDIKDRYEAFIRVMRQWRFLKLLKRGSIGNEPERGLGDVKEGELTVPCLACPRPGVNLPEDWETSTPLSKQFLYHKFISLDACFRLKRRKISSEKKDPGLFTGLAYYVSQAEYQDWMANVPEQKDTSTCSGLAAVKQANIKYNRGYATTGAILCLCARHEMVEPNGTVDTTRGEKFMYSDYAVGCSQRHSCIRLLRILCYDIACQYSKRFFERMVMLPHAARIGLHRDRWKFAVPKLHIQGHERSCQENFALNWILGAGQTDGEGIERHWANLGPIATSTREMGPGHRRDTLDDHFGAWNWMKTIGLGRLLFKRRREARIQCEIQTAELLDFSCRVSDNIEKWSEMVRAWENGETEVNPYSVPERGTNEHDVRLKYAMQEEAEAKLGIPALHEVSPSAFMLLALNIEEEQRQLALDINEDTLVTSLQKTSLVDRRARLSRGLSRLRSIQQVYTPLVLGHLNGSGAPEAGETGSSVITSIVGLPSSLPEVLRQHESMKRWMEMEIEFRQAQLSSARDAIRIHLFVRSRLHTERSLHVRNQKDSTRAREALSLNDWKIEAFKLKFQAAWRALEILVGEENIGWPRLRDEDVRCFNEVDMVAMRSRRRVLGKGRKDNEEEPLILPGETRKVTSWIWKGLDVDREPQAMQDAIRVEWCKAWARKRRWDEELQLVIEEMRRTIATLEHCAKQWQARAIEWADDAASEGRSAYALRQAFIRSSLAAKFQRLWAKPDPKPRKMSAKQVVEEIEDATEDEDTDNESGEGQDDW
ncbi:hypothetical protein VNI00_018519 [Paramarasmius palmivorus]|uniref:CxC2-like cysteine cluster KDZ transposase-associated domain-containing protein n=1 Tax=Paramarasmius palmivorus TaxID=297713 RepID=A0AAW0AY12_9AGAR